MNKYFDMVAAGWDQNPLKIERARLTAEKIQAIPFDSYKSFVDFGSGTGLLGIHFKDIFAQVHLVDSSSEMLRVAQSKLTAAQINNVTIHAVDGLAALPATHSAIATLMALHHIADTEQFFVDAHATLDTNGYLIIADLYAEDGAFHAKHATFDGHNGFDVVALSALAKKTGFHVHSVTPYYEIWRDNTAGERTSYPLFMFIAQKKASPGPCD